MSDWNTGWRPIEAADLSGEAVLLAFSSGGVAIGKWLHGVWRIKTACHGEPTHWMPLPPPPGTPATPMAQVDAVEAGARAICKEDGYNPNGFCTIQNNVAREQWEPYLKQAQACLSAALPVLLDRIDELEGALRELVELKEIKERCGQTIGYVSRKDGAWEAARQALHRDVVEEMRVAAGSTL